MMNHSCSKWMDAIADCGLGKAPEPAFAAHLENCPQCRNALRDSQSMAARLDAALHRRAAVEPPLYAPERVMARLTAPPPRRPWWWSFAALASAALAMSIVMWMARPAPKAEVNALSTWRSPTQALLRPPVAQAWITTPRLGEGFFKMKPSGGIHAQ